MGNFYEMIAEMKDKDIIKVKSGGIYSFRIQKQDGVLYYIDSEGNTSKVHGKDGMVYCLDNMNGMEWVKVPKEEYVRLTDWNEIAEMFNSSETLYVGMEKEEINRWSEVDTIGITDFDDIFDVKKFYKKVVTR
jgi:hypothetical protein